VAREQYQVLVTIVSALVVQVMDAFTWIEESTKPLFHDKSVLVDIALRVRVWMVRRVQPHIPGRMRPSAAAPLVTTGAFLDLMSRHIEQVLASVVPAFWLIGFGYSRFHAAPARAESCLVGRLLQLTPFRIHRPSFGCAAPVTALEALPILHCVAAPAFASGWCLVLVHGCEHNIDKDV
jgi:hypothetical protein